MDFTLSEETKEYLMHEFSSRDVHGNGYIDSEMFQDCLHSLGINILDEDVDYLRSHFDSNGDGKLSVKELVNNISVIHTHCLKRDELMRAFAVFDVDKSGFIRLPNMLKILTLNDFMEVGEARSYLDHLCRKYDKNFDGRFDYSEFIQMFMGEDFLSENFGKSGDTT